MREREQERLIFSVFLSGAWSFESDISAVSMTARRVVGSTLVICRMASFANSTAAPGSSSGSGKGERFYWGWFYHFDSPDYMS